MIQSLSRTMKWKIYKTQCKPKSIPITTLKSKFFFFWKFLTPRKDFKSKLKPISIRITLCNKKSPIRA